MFNHTTLFEFKNENELISFLKPLHLKIDKEEITKKWRAIDENDSEVAEKEIRHFRTRIQSQDEGVTVSIHEYVNRYHDGTTSIYNCQIRGMTKNSVISNRIDKPFQYMSFSSEQFDEAFDYLCKNQVLHMVRNSTIYRFIDSNLYFLLFFLEDLFTEDIMPVMRMIWKYLRKPTADEKKWLVMLNGETAANRIIIKDIQHRLTCLQEKRIENREKRIEIKNKLKFLQEELDHQVNAYKFIIDKHKFLQYIFEIMFPEFLRHLEVR